MLAATMLRALCAVTAALYAAGVRPTPEQMTAREQVVNSGPAAPVPEELGWEDFKATFAKIYADEVE
jgi:hypothetical protein